MGRIERNRAPSDTHLRKNVANGGTRFYIEVKPGRMGAVVQTCAWIRQKWPNFSLGNNSNIGCKAMYGVHHYLHGG